MSNEQNTPPNNDSDNPIIPVSSTSEYVDDSISNPPSPPNKNGNNDEVSNNDKGGDKKSVISLSDKISLLALIISAVVGFYTIRLFNQTEKSVKISADALKLSAYALEDARRKDTIERIEAKEKNELDNLFRKEDKLRENIIMMKSFFRDSINMVNANNSLRLQIKSFIENQRTNTFNKEAIMNESRAYIIFTKPRVYGLKIDSAVSIENPFTNIGKTPAYNLRAYTTIMFGKHENDFDIKKMGNNGIDSAIVMVALATNESHYIETYEDGVYTKERDTFLKNNKLFLFIFSEIFYTDVFQKDHLAIQFMKYDIDKNDFTFCENGNFSN